MISGYLVLACKWELGKVDVISEGGYNVSHARAEEVVTLHIDISFVTMVIVSTLGDSAYIQCTFILDIKLYTLFTYSRKFTPYYLLTGCRDETHYLSYTPDQGFRRPEEKKTGSGWPVLGAPRTVPFWSIFGGKI